MSKIAILLDAYVDGGMAAQGSEAMKSIAMKMNQLGVPLSISVPLVMSRDGTANLNLTYLYNTLGAEFVLSDMYSGASIAGKTFDSQMSILRQNMQYLRTCYICENNNPPVITAYTPQGATDSITIDVLHSLGISKTTISASGLDTTPISTSDAPYFNAAHVIGFLSDIINRIDAGDDFVLGFSSKCKYFSNKSLLVDGLYAAILYAKTRGVQFVKYTEF